MSIKVTEHAVSNNKIDYMHIRYMPPRKSAAVTVAFNVDKDTIHVALAITNPMDQFVKKTGRILAAKRLSSTSDTTDDRYRFDVTLDDLNRLFVDQVRIFAKNVVPSSVIKFKSFDQLSPYVIRLLIESRVREVLS